MRLRPVPALAVAVALPLLLTGCSIGDVLQHQTSGTASDPAALRQAWSTPASLPQWIPADSTDIRYIAATGGDAGSAPATVRVTTTSALPRTCTEITRRSLDSFGPDWAPDGFPDRVGRCGNWDVMAVDGGWFGWTPLAPSEVE